MRTWYVSCVCGVGGMLFRQRCMQPVLQLLSHVQELECIKNCLCCVVAWRHNCCLYYDGSWHRKTAGKGNKYMQYGRKKPGLRQLLVKRCHCSFDHNLANYYVGVPSFSKIFNRDTCRNSVIKSSLNILPYLKCASTLVWLTVEWFYLPPCICLWSLVSVILIMIMTMTTMIIAVL